MRVTNDYMEKLASAIDGTIKQSLGEDGCGFIFVLVTGAEDDSTDVNWVANIKDEDVKNILTGLVTMNETKN